MYINEDGDYVTGRTCVDEETGEEYKEYTTYQANGYIRVNCVYPDGMTTEEFHKEPWPA